MKSFVGLLLAVCITLPACSAENSSTTSPVAASPEPAAAVTTPEPAGQPVLAQVTEPVAPAATPQAEPSAAASMPVTAPAPRPDIVAGRHYRVLTPAQPTSSSPDKVEVAEVFMYSCPHCMSFEPFIQNYLAEKPAYVSFVRIPASFNKMARVHSKAYYAAETLGVLEDVHADFFTEFHNKRNRLDSEEEIITFFARHGVDKDAATKAFGSFAVDTKLRQADNLGRRYGIDSVPALVINGKYVTSGSMTGSISKLREVVDYLTAKEAAAL
ncbi:MAG: DsbA family protein [Gammaproteobacteria bacterium]|nr:DsbA family protein [Gammaproteobacteria bacterium]NNF59703.1 thioredoxin domain-containing protein [Gammaproteobacteria bacterium]